LKLPVGRCASIRVSAPSRCAPSRLSLAGWSKY
jgi:hypothetical protein